jgi:hypothetical protein
VGIGTVRHSPATGKLPLYTTFTCHPWEQPHALYRVRLFHRGGHIYVSSRRL